ncbi:methionyl-tRNA formyltransferase [Canibacter oris]|uniref:Methionyl-tRNA formyltransferase n=1 Tax=Canibacter oris TaxID=1365628 RepID=A0A840DJN8_9MICO|nr:methionyl-tRNA formyltransferase [Canibacter oris]MBB4071923.1 methionyl-tRNA formyltransferase [Canibacter oris]
MRIVFAGTPAVALPTLAALIQHPAHQVVGVLTRTDAPQGRKRVLTQSPVAELAAAHDIPTLKANRLDDEATTWVRQLQPDIGVVVAYGALLREELLQTPRLGWINLHFSALPAWRGAAPVQRALMAGETTIGIDVFRLVAELDAGDIVARDSYQATPGQSAGEVLQEMAAAGSTTVFKALDELAANPAAGTAQQGEVSYAHKLQRTDGLLDFAQPAAAVLARWAGVTPEPGAYVEFEGAALKLVQLQPLTVEQQQRFARLAQPLKPGEAIIWEKQMLIACGAGAVLAPLVQQAGKKAMQGSDWLRGRGAKAELNG